MRFGKIKPSALGKAGKASDADEVERNAQADAALSDTPSITVKFKRRKDK